ncbi:MAG TPA: rod shape-determining protein MreD [Gemmatimonadota bacterium]
MSSRAVGAREPGRIATLRGAPDQLAIRSRGRFLLLLAAFFLGHVLLEPHLAVNGVSPDFYLMAVVFGALRWGPLWGAAFGFLLGINRDAMALDHFGMHGLALTIGGFVLGKTKESLYLDVPALDLVLIFASALVTGAIVTAIGYHDSFSLFEDRFFYEVPLSALYTAVVGGLVFRLLKD